MCHSTFKFDPSETIQFFVLERKNEFCLMVAMKVVSDSHDYLILWLSNKQVKFWGANLNFRLEAPLSIKRCTFNRENEISAPVLIDWSFMVLIL